MDRLRTMQSFVRVMHAGSFTVAARQLGISRALVSRHIIDLEVNIASTFRPSSSSHQVSRSFLKTDAFRDSCRQLFETPERPAF